jgi:DNA repair protein RadC
MSGKRTSGFWISDSSGGCRYEGSGIRAEQKTTKTERHPMNTLAKAMDYAAMIEACASYVAVKKPLVREPEAVHRLLAPLCQQDTQEGFYVITLDTKNRATREPIRVTQGLLNSAPVHPREVFKPAITESAAAVIIAHNHPSGDPTPSAEDITITKRLMEAGKLIGILILDHVIIGKPDENNPGFISMRARGLVSFE